MKYFEMEHGPESTAISVPRGLMCYLVQDERPKYWVAALASEVESGNWPLTRLLHQSGIIPDEANRMYKRLDVLRGTGPEDVKAVRDIIVDAYYQERDIIVDAYCQDQEEEL